MAFPYRIHVLGPAVALVSMLALAACTMPADPEPLTPEYGDRSSPPVEPDPTLQYAALDFQIGDLTDPEVMARYARVDLLITDPARFWDGGGHAEDIALLKAANPDLKIIGFFRSKCVRLEWAGLSAEDNPYCRALYEASRPYWAMTTTGDTAQDWTGVALFDFTNPAARRAMLDVFVAQQESSPYKLDGVHWDYFNNSLWISPDVHTMEGDPDLDGDGIAHWDDEDELQAFRDAQVDWIQEMRAIMGEGFIQTVNGARALVDSNFASLVDGMLYEVFPNVGLGGSERYRAALDPGRYNNLFAAHNWPRTRNGGPWLMLSNKNPGASFIDSEGQQRMLDLGDLNRAIALLTGGVSMYYDQTGRHAAGIPSVELALGEPLGPVSIDGDVYRRTFAHGRIELVMGSGDGADPFAFQIFQDGDLVQVYDRPRYDP